jgi:hypothetical protein
MAGRLAQILEQEYKTKGLVGGLATGFGKSFKEKTDLSNLFFSGSGVMSVLGRKIFGKGYSALRDTTPKTKLSSLSPDRLTPSIEDSPVLIDISKNMRILAKNSFVLPEMAKQNNIMQKNIQKLVSLQGGTPTKKADAFFSSAKFRENAYEASLRSGSKTVSPTPARKEESKPSSLFGDMGGLFSSLTGSLIPLIATATAVGVGLKGLSVLLEKFVEWFKNSWLGKQLGLNTDSTVPSQSESFGSQIADVAAIGAGTIAGVTAVKGASKLITASKATSTAIMDARTMSVSQLAQSDPKTKWGRFLKFVAQKSPKLWGRIGLKLAQAGALATIPIAGWIAAAVQLGLSIWAAWEIYELWNEFNGTKEEKEMSGTETSPEQVSSTPTQVPSSVPSSAAGSTGASASGSARTTPTAFKGQTIDSESAMKYLMDRGGFTREQAAGIVGNLMQESSLNSGANNESEGSFGLAQWRLDRLANLKKFATANRKPITDPYLQLDFLMHELNTTEKKANLALRSATSAEESAFVFGKLYERPKVVEQSRLNYAAAAASGGRISEGSVAVADANRAAGKMGSGGVVVDNSSTSVSQGGSTGKPASTYDREISQALLGLIT